jgi:4-hydroxy-tetrahydrodipicolinate synthase
MTLCAGLSAFPITPATPEGRVIEADLRAILRRIAAGGADSVGLLGSTGTYMFLERDERRRATAIAVETLTDTPVIVGVGALRTDHARAVARDAAAEGAAGLLLAPVSYTPLTEEEVFRHFAAVAEAPCLSRQISSPSAVGRPLMSPFTDSPNAGRSAAWPRFSSASS